MWANRCCDVIASLSREPHRRPKARPAAGALVVVEWARERFDEATAQWCFDRLPQPPDEHDWLQRHRDQWPASGLPWDGYCRDWAEQEGLHAGQDIVRELDARFDP